MPAGLGCARRYMSLSCLVLCYMPCVLLSLSFPFLTHIDRQRKEIHKRRENYLNVCILHRLYKIAFSGITTKETFRRATNRSAKLCLRESVMRMMSPGPHTRSAVLVTNLNVLGCKHLHYIL